VSRALSCRRRQGLGTRGFRRHIRFHQSRHSEMERPGLAARIDAVAGAVLRALEAPPRKRLNHISKSPVRALLAAHHGSQKARTFPLDLNSSLSLIACLRRRVVCIHQFGAGLADRVDAEETCCWAIFADIHANRQAFQRLPRLCTGAWRGAYNLPRGYVGYGADRNGRLRR